MIKSLFLTLTGISPSSSDRSRSLKLQILDRKTITTPHLYYVAITDSVWADSFSFATTWEISIDFFSTAYSDASLPLVRSQLPL